MWLLTIFKERIFSSCTVQESVTLLFCEFLFNVVSSYVSEKCQRLRISRTKELADQTLERKNPSCSGSENKCRYWNLPIQPWSRGKIQAALVPEINAGTGTCRSNLKEEKSKLLWFRK
jgi:hypothetical protein